MSGKFFSEKDNTKEVFDKDIFYSNAQFVELVQDKEKIETCVGDLKLVNLSLIGGISSYILTLNGCTFDFDNSYDFPQASNQFRILLSFWFQSIFEYEKSDVKRQCRESIRNSKEEMIPKNVLPRYFNQEKICLNVDDFSDFIKKVTNLSRNDYKSIMNSLNIFYQAVTSVDYNLELSYSLFVFSVESLCQKFDDFEESWDFYDAKVKSCLDRLVEKYDVTSEDYVTLQNTLLEIEHQKLSKRFINFSMKYVDDSFFKEEAIGVNSPLKKSELRMALQTIYSIRSGYVHSLKGFEKVEKLMLLKSENEVISDETSIFLSISGLERLIHHILKNFILKLDAGEFEEINPTDELPDFINMRLAPQYWISNPDSFEPRFIYDYFYGLLNLLNTLPQDVFVYFTDLVLKIEQYINSGIKKEFKIATLSFYYLCNKFYDEKGISENFNTISSNKEFVLSLNTLTIETLIARLVLLERIEWKLEDIVELYNTYEKRKFNKNKLKLPHFYETLILAYISNSYFQNDDSKNFKIWLEKLILDLPSKDSCQDYLNKCLEDHESINMNTYVALFFSENKK